MADNNTVARPYAQAAFEVARENDALAELSESFAAAKALLADGQVVEFLAVPSLNDEQRLEFLQGLFANAVDTDGAAECGILRRKLAESQRIDNLIEFGFGD